MNTRSTGRTSSASAASTRSQIGGIGVDHAAARVGHQDAFAGAVDHAP